MSLLGKILAIFNIFGVAAFIFLAAKDYAVRHTWQYAVFRQDLAIQGLPVDDTVRDLEGNSVAEHIGEQTRKELFPKDPVTTQAEEVQRVQAQVKNLANQQATNRKALPFYATFLLPFAQTNTERQRLRAYREFLSKDDKADGLRAKFKDAWAEAATVLAAKPKEGESKPQPREAALAALDARHLESARPFVDLVMANGAAPGANGDAALDAALDAQPAKLADQLDGLFKDAMRADTDPTPRDRRQTPETRRQRIAFLLFNVYGSLQEWGAPAGGAEENRNLEDIPDYKRFLTVVGLRQGAQAVQEEAAVLSALVGHDPSGDDVRTARHRDRSLFAVQHQKVLDQIRVRAAQVEAENTLLARGQQRQLEHDVEFKKLKRDVGKAEEEYRLAQEATDKQLEDLRAISESLFKERVKLRDATEENQKLEKEIRQMEKDH